MSYDFNRGFQAGLQSCQRQMEEQISDLEKQLAVAQHFCQIRKCRACDGYYPNGYVCQCGEDNSIGDDE